MHLPLYLAVMRRTALGSRLNISSPFSPRACVPLRNISRRPKKKPAHDEQVNLFIMHGAVIKHRGHITVEG